MASVALKDSAGAASFRLLWLVLATYVGFVALGYGGVLLSGPARTVSLIWPSTAFAVVMIVRFSRGRLTDLAMLAAVFAAAYVIAAPPSLDLAAHLSGPAVFGAWSRECSRDAVYVTALARIWRDGEREHADW